jgi:hypothetical protein
MGKLDTIQETLQHNRPTASATTLRTYASLLRGFFYRHHPGSADFDIEWFKDADNMLHLVADLQPTPRKGILSAILAATCAKGESDEKIKAIMLQDTTTIKGTISSHKTAKEEANWVSQADVRARYDALVRETAPLWKKNEKTPADIQAIQQQIILACTGGLFIPPRRSLDWCSFKLRNMNKASAKADGVVDANLDNYRDGSKLFFNRYKTAKSYGEQQVAIPRPFGLLLTKWAAVQRDDYLLCDLHGRPLTNVSINQKLNEIFGKHVSVNILRHSFISEKFPGVDIETITQNAHDMGNSIGEQLAYIKR